MLSKFEQCAQDQYSSFAELTEDFTSYCNYCESDHYGNCRNKELYLHSGNPNQAKKKPKKQELAPMVPYEKRRIPTVYCRNFNLKRTEQVKINCICEEYCKLAVDVSNMIINGGISETELKYYMLCVERLQFKYEKYNVRLQRDFSVHRSIGTYYPKMTDYLSFCVNFYDKNEFNDRNIGYFNPQYINFLHRSSYDEKICEIVAHKLGLRTEGYLSNKAYIALKLLKKSHPYELLDHGKFILPYDFGFIYL